MAALTGHPMAERTLEDFALSDAESLALTLAKLALMEMDLENDRSHKNRVVKREVVRRYCGLLNQLLEVPDPGEDARELTWAQARKLADQVVSVAEAAVVVTRLPDRLAPLGSDARRYLITSPQLAAASLGGIDQRRRAIVLMIELAAFQPWPESTGWDSDTRR
jgi:hypothetical protein